MKTDSLVCSEIIFWIPTFSCWFKAMKCLIRYFSVSLEYGTVMIVTKRMTNVLLSCHALNSLIVTLRGYLNMDQLRGGDIVLITQNFDPA